MAKLLALAALLATDAAPAAPELAPAAPEVIAAAVADCWAATEAGKVNEAVLEAKGWKAGKLRTNQGKAVQSALRVLGREGSSVFVLVMTTKTGPTCTVTSRVGSSDALGKAAKAVQTALLAITPELKTSREGAGVGFIALPRLALLDPTGTKARPSVRIVVSNQGAANK